MDHYPITGMINASETRASIDFSEDFVKLQTWFIKKYHAALSREITTPLYKSHITLFLQKDHIVHNLPHLLSLHDSPIEINIFPHTLIHTYTRHGADMFLYNITDPNVLNIIQTAGITYKYGEMKPHLTICSNKGFRKSIGL